MIDLPKPKPCPFCGHSEIGVVEGESFRYCRSMCPYCGAQGPEVRKNTLADNQGAANVEANTQAIEEWNTRADLLPTIEDLVDLIAIEEDAYKLAEEILKRIGGGANE